MKPNLDLHTHTHIAQVDWKCSQLQYITWPHLSSLLHSPLWLSTFLSAPGLSAAIWSAVKLSGLSLPFTHRRERATMLKRCESKQGRPSDCSQMLPSVNILGFPDLQHSRHFQGKQILLHKLSWCKPASIALLPNCMFLFWEFFLTSQSSVCAQKPEQLFLCVHASPPFYTRVCDMKTCVSAPSCSGFIHAGVILSTKACIRFLDIVRAGAMNYLSAHVIVKAFFFCNLPPSHPFPRLLRASRQDLDLSKLQRDTERLSVSQVMDRFTVPLGQQNERQCGTCGWRICGSLSADSQVRTLGLWQHFSEKGSSNYHSPLCRCWGRPTAATAEKICGHTQIHTHVQLHHQISPKCFFFCTTGKVVKKSMQMRRDT